MAEGDSKAEKKTPPSMSMIEPRLRNIYLQFYKESYFTPSALDLKTKELIAIGCSVIAKCEGCLEGHLKKARQMGITKEEISDALAIAIGIAAAAVLDFSDKAAIKLDLHHFDEP
jgi:AhpD family alkylhydroperoxidase